MRVRTASLTLLLVFVAGVIAYVLRLDHAVDPAPGPAPRSDAAAGPDGAVPGLAGPGSTNDVEGGSRSGLAVDPGPSSAALPGGRTARAFAGRVVDGLAQPIPGADVIVASADGSSGIPLERLDSAKLDGLQLVRTSTDALGRFLITLPLTGATRFGVRASGFALHERTIPLPNEDTTDLGDIVLVPGVVLRGRVLDSARAPVVGARLTRLDVDASPAVVLGSSEQHVNAVTGEDGSFAIADLAPGAWSLLVVADDHPEKLERGLAESGRVASDVEIVLEDGLEIRGRVVGAPAEALADLWIRAIPDPGTAAGKLYAGDHVDPERFVVRPRGARCAADGTFVVRGLQRGLDYVVSARVGEHDFFGPIRTGQMTARAGARDVELVYRVATALAFQVVDGATQQPVTEFEVHLGRAHVQALANDDGSVRRAFPDGRVRVVHGLDGGGDEPLELRVEARGYATARMPEVRLSPGQEKDLGVVRLVPASVIAVRVVADATGAPIAGARVSLAPEAPGAQEAPERVASNDASHSAWHTAESDADGLARLNAVGGAPVRLRVEHPDFAPFRGETAGSGSAREEVVRLRAGGTVIVEVRDATGAAVRGLRIAHTSAVQDVGADDVRDPDRWKTDAEGRVSFAHLAPGEHAFELVVRRAIPSPPIAGADAATGAADEAALGSAARRVVVADGRVETLTWIVPARGRLTGRVTTEGRAVSGATLQFTPRGVAGSRPSETAEALKARTNGSGDYALNGVELGTYGVTVVHPSRVMPFETEIAIENLRQAFDVALPTTSIHGRIVDGEGRAIAGVRVQVERRAELSNGVMGIPVLSGSDGSYALLGVQGDVDLEVAAFHPDYQRAHSGLVRVAPGERRANVDFALVPGAVLEVTVTRAGPSCRVRAIHDDVSDAAAPTTLAPVTANGIARLEGLRPGRWRIQLEGCTDPAPGVGDAPLEQIVDVAAGRVNRARFELP